MTRLNAAEWSYLLGCISSVGAILFRSLFFFPPTKRMGVSICVSTSLKPSSLLHFSVLCFVFSIALLNYR